MEKEKKVKKPKSKARKVIDWVVTCLFAGLFLFIAAYQIVGNASKKDNYGVPVFAGSSTLVVQTDSMEPKYKVGEAVFVKKVNASTLKVGDAVTFYYATWNKVVTHEIISIEVDDTKTYGQGQYTITVHGINTDSNQCHESGGSRDCTYQTQVFDESVLIGKVVGKSAVIGFVYSFLTKPIGLLVVLLIPCLYLIITSVLDIFKALKEEDKVVAEEEANPTDSGSSDALADLSEEEKERLKQELLQEMIGGGNNEEK